MNSRLHRFYCGKADDAANAALAVLESALLAVAMIPAVLLGAIPGIWLGNRISKPALRRIAFVLIALLGLYMILGPLLQS